MNNVLYQLEFADGVRRQLERLPGQYYQRVKRIVEALKSNPRPANAERLRGKTDRYKIALGEYRIVYRVKDEILIILLLKVGKKHDPEFYADVGDEE